MAKPSNTPVARWSPPLAGLRALTIRQPWAWLIINGCKDVENRSKRTNYRGPILVHAGLNITDFSEVERIERKHGIRIPESLEIGGVIGVVDIVDCVERHSSPWHERGKFAWVLANPRRLKFRACKGSLGVFQPEFI
jgi:hypothetical protein